MHTFTVVWLPKPSILDSVRNTPVDYLKNSLSAAKRILAILEAKKTDLRGGRVAGANLPDVLMWEGYESCLKFYCKIASIELVMVGEYETLEFFEEPISNNYPWWFGYPTFHESHSTFNELVVMYPTEDNMKSVILRWKENMEKAKNLS